MRICNNCGVEIDDAERCPLCGSQPTEAVQEEREKPEDDVSPRTAAENQVIRSAKIWAFEMISLVAFTAAIVAFASDFAFGFEITWSIYPLTSIAFVWLFAGILIALAQHPVGGVIAETLLTGGFLLALSEIIGSAGWFLTIALPITLLVGFVGAVVILVAKVFKPSVLQMVAIAFLSAGLFLVGLDLILSLHTEAEAPVSWSLVAFACTLSLFFLILFIDRRLREKHSEFKKIFHF
jgi:hypothetical protein